jgi:pSer/pThr/pTyr-binding forkhead associated (FHA) protein
VARRSDPTVAFDEGTAMLVITSASEPEQAHALGTEEVSIGRADGNDIVIKDIYASRRHARILVEGTQYIWMDYEGVTRPSSVNGDPVSGRVPLQDGDRIEVGETVLVFHQTQSKPSSFGQSRGTSAVPARSQGQA